MKNISLEEMIYSNCHLSGGPAELLNSRDTILLLPEDLTASFACTIGGHGGTATLNIKRYDSILIQMTMYSKENIMFSFEGHGGVRVIACHP